MSLKLSGLKSLYDKGFALIYLHPKQKRPLKNKWTTGPRATWEELQRDFDPSYNVGCRLGSASQLENGYLMCLDLDIKDPKYKKEALAKLKEVIGDTEYPIVFSGSGNGSRHLYGVSKEPFKMVEIEKHKGKWEICAYSDGRQMVLPPSVHPNGNAYKWRDETASSFPRFKIKTLQAYRGSALESGNEKSTSSFKAVDVDLYSSKLDVPTIKKITEGRGVEDRSAELLSIAMKMCRAGFDDNQILSVLSDENNWIASAAYEHAQSRDRARAVRWLDKYTLQKARHETNVMRLFEKAEDYSELPKLSMEKKEKLVKDEKEINFPDIDGNMKPKNTLRNLMHALEFCLGGAVVGFNEFTCRPYFLKDTVYGGMKDREVSDKDDLNLKHYLSTHYRFEPSKELCFEAHAILAQHHKFHPVKAYLESLTWDGVVRLDTWLVDAFRASGPEEYLEAIGRKVLVAAVARIYEPGCKFDYMTVLEGNQGEGKSISLGMLVGSSWFTDSLGDIHNKDVVDQMLGKWLIEVSELDSIRGREAEAVKAFVSRQVDRVRLSYARRAEDYPRQCIFIGSTNDQEYLTDETGNRRYWPVKVGMARRKWLKENRDQLWAEAKFRYELGEKLYLSKELEAVARGEQEKRFEVDEWEAQIVTSIKDGNGPFITTELWRVLHANMANGQPTMVDAKRIGRVMRRLGFKKSNKKFEGVDGKCWVKE